MTYITLVSHCVIYLKSQQSNFLARFISHTHTSNSALTSATSTLFNLRTLIGLVIIQPTKNELDITMDPWDFTTGMSAIHQLCKVKMGFQLFALCLPQAGWCCCCSAFYVGFHQSAEITVHNLKCISCSRSKYRRNWWQKYASTKYQPHQSLVLICWQNDDESNTEGICLPVSGMKTVPHCSYLVKDSQC